MRSWCFSLPAGSVKVDVSPGRSELALGILDPGTGRPEAAFANKFALHERWHVPCPLAVEAGR